MSATSGVSVTVRCSFMRTHVRVSGRASYPQIPSSHTTLLATSISIPTLITRPAATTNHPKVVIRRTRHAVLPWQTTLLRTIGGGPLCILKVIIPMWHLPSVFSGSSMPVAPLSFNTNASSDVRSPFTFLEPLMSTM